MPAPLRLARAARTPAPGCLRDRVVLVTGAGGGLGRATALAAAQAGANVVLLGRKVRVLERLYDELEAHGGPTPAIYPLDLEGATPRDYEALADTLAREFGRLDGIAHCAAHFNTLQPFGQIEPLEWARTQHVNVTAPLWLTQACLPLLEKAADAAVVFVLDDPQRMGRAYWGAYGVAKQALATLVSILHEETENSAARARVAADADAHRAAARGLVRRRHRGAARSGRGRGGARLAARRRGRERAWPAAGPALTREAGGTASRDDAVRMRVQPAASGSMMWGSGRW